MHSTDEIPKFPPQEKKRFLGQAYLKVDLVSTKAQENPQKTKESPQNREWQIANAGVKRPAVVYILLRSCSDLRGDRLWTRGGCSLRSCRGLRLSLVSRPELTQRLKERMCGHNQARKLPMPPPSKAPCGAVSGAFYLFECFIMNNYIFI